MKIGDIINGNMVTDIIDHVVYFRCGKCGNPFEHGKARLRFRLPKSCGCEVKNQHDRAMAACFFRRRVQK